VRVLLTGGAGFIGSYVAGLVLQGGHEVAVVDDLSTGRRENVPKGAQFYEADIRSGCAEIFRDFEPEALCHQAAQMDMRRSVKEPDFDAEVNVLGTVRLLQNCAEHDVKQVVFASTGGAIYGEQQVLLAPEDHPLYPVSPTGSPSSRASATCTTTTFRSACPTSRSATPTSTGQGRTRTEKQGSWRSSATTWQEADPRR
jgi:UDP-glucose 4-epimerase